LEEHKKALIDPTLEGKTKEQLGLKPFTCTEIRSSIMRIPVSVILRVLFQDVLSGSSSHARFRLRGVLVIARGGYLSGFGPKTFISN